MNQSELEAVMGPYMPTTAYLQPNQVETFLPCLAMIPDTP